MCAQHLASTCSTGFLLPRRLLADGKWLLRPNQSGRNPLGAGVWFWVPDGSGLLGLASVEDGPPWRIFERPVDGSADPQQMGLVTAGFPEDTSPDGTEILYTGPGLTASSARVGAGEGTDRLLVDTGDTVYTPRFSPDGQWIVYGIIDENGTSAIYVQPFPGGVENRQSIGNGLNPQWRGDGKEIAYLDFEDAMRFVWSVRVRAEGRTLNFSRPERLFSVRAPAYLVPRMSPLAVSPDGSRFYFVQGVEQPGSDVIHVRKGWPGSS